MSGHEWGQDIFATFDSDSDVELNKLSRGLSTHLCLWLTCDCVNAFSESSSFLTGKP